MLMCMRLYVYVYCCVILLLFCRYRFFCFQFQLMWCSASKKRIMRPNRNNDSYHDQCSSQWLLYCFVIAHLFSDLNGGAFNAFSKYVNDTEFGTRLRWFYQLAFVSWFGRMFYSFFPFRIFCIIFRIYLKKNQYFARTALNTSLSCVIASKWWWVL